MNQLEMIPSHLKLGISFCAKKLLIIAIILLGLQVSLIKLIQVGGYLLLFIVVMISLALFNSYFLGKLLSVPARLACLIGIGVSVCGNTAISATAPLISADEKETTTAIGVNTLFGTLAVILYPLLGSLMNTNEFDFGLWAGTAINDTSQVVAAGVSYGKLSGEVATSTKLIRNTLMGIVITLAPLIFLPKKIKSLKEPWYKKVKVPYFIGFFFLMAAFNSLGLVSMIESATAFDLLMVSQKIAKFFILMALCAIGLSTSFTDLKAHGYQAILLGFLVALFNGSAALLIISVVGNLFK